MKDTPNSARTTSRRKKWTIWLRDALILLAIVLGINAWQSRNMLEDDGGVIIADQRLVSLQGEVLYLLDADKPDLIYFFAPWCQICALSIGNLAYLNSEKINVVVVALDYGAKEEVQAFVDAHSVQARVLLGHNALKEAFSIQGYPSYYLIGDNNEVVSRSYGYSTALGLKLREAFGN